MKKGKELTQQAVATEWQKFKDDLEKGGKEYVDNSFNGYEQHRDELGENSELEHYLFKELMKQADAWNSIERVLNNTTDEFDHFHSSLIEESECVVQEKILYIVRKYVECRQRQHGDNW